ASEGVLTRLYAKALALEDGKGTRVVILTTDLIGLPRSITDAVSARAMKEYGLERARLLFNSSHTHTGPVVRPNLISMYDLNEAEDARLKVYARKLTEDLFAIIGAALGKLAPARLEFGQSTAGFAINRREFTPAGVKLGLAPKGPVDHSVPVLAVRGEDGSFKAVLFGYACHNTTLSHYMISADYAGYAQTAIEKEHPGAQAMFLLLCGGDQNPNPRRTDELAEQHGKALAAGVEQVLALAQREPVRAPIKAAYQVTNLRFAVHTREQFEKEAKDSNVHKARRARQMLALYDERRETRSTPYPVQAIRFHKDLTILALGGEVVVDYALRAKKENPKERLVVAGYSNDVMCYIPSLRVLKEGGYEANDSMIYYGMPGPFSEDVEETVFLAIRSVLKRVGVK
ncbi:MAG: neutral/alkaline non-lysosomal ceramidase N-terminal domain-containing protein, partial [Acidobacteriia bacterium]|nr:neutral/alkaline non-lysosomal ceramidase N-terminal domain-containing protein [Terriglobia bacterium]